MEKGIEIIAELMKVAALTAPKAIGQDFIDVKIATEEEIGKIVDEMFRLAKEENNPGFDRDGNNLLASGGLVLVGVRDHKGIGLDCGSCGFENCAEFNAGQKTDKVFNGPNCMLRLLDLGIALGSAAKTAQINNVDNRIMYRVGVAAKNANIMESNVIMGIPLSVSSKSIYYDR
ncbi:MAG: hypothetical protein KAS67_03450 [Thermoplasmata archaeon]|nr:hypothetical protein [Thermoplasmata archaeon]